MSHRKGRKATITQVKDRYQHRFLAIPGVVGVGIGRESGTPVLKVYVARKSKSLSEKIPAHIEGYPVAIEVTGEFKAEP